MQAAEEERLQPIRKRLHQQLLLPVDRPLLRTGNAAKLDGGGISNGGVLCNVHQGLKPSGVGGGAVHTIWGTYSYHHYMQVLPPANAKPPMLIMQHLQEKIQPWKELC